MGINLGAGHAEAKIEPGQYKSKYFQYGLIPFPESNVKVTENRFSQDFYGVGPVNYSNQPIRQTKAGGVVGSGDPVLDWFGRTEYRKTPNGYRGTQYVFGGIATGDLYLKKVR